jgi:hypothetical protein
MPCGQSYEPSRDFDAEDFIIAFFRQRRWRQIETGVADSWPEEDEMGQKVVTLRQEVARVMEIAEQIETLSPGDQSRAYLFAMLDQMTEEAAAPPTNRQRRRQRPLVTRRTL